MKARQTIRRTISLLSTTAGWLMMVAGSARASYPVTGTPPPQVQPAQPSLPFTGANVSAGFLILIGLLIVGGVLLSAGRRRRIGARR
jgi:LPXTG-motif cell wall-anchored protein